MGFCAPAHLSVTIFGPRLAQSCFFLAPALPIPACDCLFLPVLAYYCLSLTVPACSCLFLPVPACSCRFLPIPACSCLSLPVPAYPCLSLPFHACLCLSLPVPAYPCLLCLVLLAIPCPKSLAYCVEVSKYCDKCFCMCICKCICKRLYKRLCQMDEQTQAVDIDHIIVLVDYIV